MLTCVEDTIAVLFASLYPDRFGRGGAAEGGMRLSIRHHGVAGNVTVVEAVVALWPATSKDNTEQIGLQ